MRAVQTVLTSQWFSTLLVAQQARAQEVASEASASARRRHARGFRDER
jgi:hypothetical protein